jgi:hypothetical protein
LAISVSWRTSKHCVMAEDAIALHATRSGGGNRKSRDNRLPEARLDEFIEQATVGAYDESERTEVFTQCWTSTSICHSAPRGLGVEVGMKQVDISDDNHIVAICRRNRSNQSIPIFDLPLPNPPRTEWIAAYCRWVPGR